ncbi:MAG: helix-turn-helix domain-containing protein [Pseudomonadota bacterium]
MIRRGFRRSQEEVVEETAGFDAFELRLGDLMRGERATMGKSLLDVQRELKIKAAYIAAIENADPTAFDTPGFIAGYVRSYARYLNMDPDWAFETFCKESGFATAHGMSDEASGKKPIAVAPRPLEKDIFVSPATPFVPAGESLFSGVEPRAIGSFAVLLGLIGGLGWGGWTVLQEVQKVQLAPVENTPTVVADIDPLAGGGLPATDAGIDVVARFDTPSTEALDRLYRPQALDAPVMVPRDGPIATLDPSQTGLFAPTSEERPGLLAEAAPDALPSLEGPETSTAVQVTEAPRPGVQLVAVRPAWVRVRAADGSVIYESIMNAGDIFDVPQTEEPATLRIGESGAVYFAVNGTHYGPVGPRGAVSSNVALSADNLTATYAVADAAADSDFCGLAVSGDVTVAGITTDFTCP